jgi:hypothetical protein
VLRHVAADESGDPGDQELHFRDYETGLARRLAKCAY